MAGTYVPPQLRKQAAEQTAFDNRRPAEPMPRTQTFANSASGSGGTSFSATPSSSGPVAGASNAPRDAAPPVPTNSRWKGLDEAAPVGSSQDRSSAHRGGDFRDSRDDRDYRDSRDARDNRDSRDSRPSGGYFGGDRQAATRAMYGGDSRRSDGYGNNTNSLGFHGEERPNARQEKEIFHTEAVQTTGINFDKVLSSP
jgi:hypothetical protein